jgi:hypothetical protein
VLSVRPDVQAAHAAERGAADCAQRGETARALIPFEHADLALAGSPDKDVSSALRDHDRRGVVDPVQPVETLVIRLDEREPAVRGVAREDGEAVVARAAHVDVLAVVADRNRLRTVDSVPSTPLVPSRSASRNVSRPVVVFRTNTATVSSTLAAT